MVLSLVLRLICLSSVMSASISNGNPPSPKWIDMSYPFIENVTIYWPGIPLYRHNLVFEGDYPGTKIFVSASEFKAGEHGGTHMDAPKHFTRNGITLEKISIESMVGDAIVVNVSAKCENDRDYQMTLKDLQDWEKQHGRIPDNSIVFMYTGNGKFWPDQKKYFGTDTPLNTSTFHFPGMHVEAAKWLVKNKRIKLFGIDTPSFDFGPSHDFGTHLALLNNNIPGIENVANLHLLPPKGAEVFAAPMKIKDGSGGPCRLYARITDKTTVNGGVGRVYLRTGLFVLMSIIHFSCNLFS